MNATFLEERMQIYHMTTGLPIRIYSNTGKILRQIGMPECPFSFLGIYPKECILKKQPQTYHNYLSDYEEQFLSFHVFNKDSSNVIVIGPFRYKMQPLHNIQKIAKKAKLNKNSTIDLQKYYYSLPVIKTNSVYHHYKYMEFLFKSTSMIFQNPQEDLMGIQLTEKNKIEYREIDFYHHNYLWEKRIDALFKDRFYPLYDQEMSTVEPAIISTNMDRNQHILFIISLGVFERYAIEHELDPDIAYTITDTYLQKMEESKTLSEIDQLLQEVAIKYRKALALINQSKYSKIVYETIHYIHRNLLTKCNLVEISSHLNVHPDYLSKLFKKELGIPFTDYVLKEKTEEAKILLKYTNISLAEISEALNFSSKSYFIKCFKKQEGITPGEYVHQRNLTEMIALNRTSFKSNMYMYHMTTGLPVRIYTLDGVLVHDIGMPHFPFDVLGSYPMQIIPPKNSFYHHQTDYEEHFIALQAASDQGKSYILVIGPYKYQMPTTSEITGICEKAGIGKFKTIAMQKYFYSLPVSMRSSEEHHFQYLKLLFDGTSIRLDDNEHELCPMTLMEKNMMEYGVIDFYEHTHLMEKRNMDRLFKRRIHPFQDHELSMIERTLSSSHYRTNPKSIAILNLSLFARYAIEQGLDTHLSFTINDAYLRMIEGSDNLSDMDLLMQDAFRKYQKALEVIHQSQYSKRLQEAMRYINHHLSQKFSLKDVADHVKVHPNYLSELMKKELGMSFTDYVLKERIEEAKILLQYSDNSLAEIAGILNFSSKSYFIRCFKKIEGVTPGQYSQQKDE